MSDRDQKGPVIIDLDSVDTAQTPATAAPISDDPGDTPDGRAMRMAAHLGARRPSRLARWFWGLLAGLIALVVGVAFWDFVSGLFDRVPLLGMLALGLTGLFALVALVIALREVSALSRLRNLDALRTRAEAARVAQDLAASKSLSADLEEFYKGRPEIAWGQSRLSDRRAELIDSDAVLAVTERELIAPLDARALAEVEAASRQVATVTALVPLALADVAAALLANTRMIRRIAEVYGGRGGVLGAWRLTRAVLTHLAATGAVAVGDDLISSVAGGGVLSKVSRRFGEGLVNGALTARVGVAAIEVCRPLPFSAVPRPSVTGIVRRALTGLFG